MYPAKPVDVPLMLSRPALSKAHDPRHHGLQQLSLREEHPTHKGLQGSLEVHTGTATPFCARRGEADRASLLMATVTADLSSRTLHRRMDTKSKRTSTPSTTTVSPAERPLQGRSPLDDPKRPHMIAYPVRSCSSSVVSAAERAPPLRCPLHCPYTCCHL